MMHNRRNPVTCIRAASVIYAIMKNKIESDNPYLLQFEKSYEMGLLFITLSSKLAARLKSRIETNISDVHCFILWFLYFCHSSSAAIERYL